MKQNIRRTWKFKFLRINISTFCPNIESLDQLLGAILNRRLIFPVFDRRFRKGNKDPFSFILDRWKPIGFSIDWSRFDADI